MKDPSFLFYPADFLTGTMFMSNEDIGIYVKLLCAQHQHGGIIEKTAFNSLVKENSIVRTKFIESEEGFFNKRLMIEMEKRSIKSTNLSANAKLRWEKEKQKEYKSNAIALDMNMPTVDRDINDNKDKNPSKKAHEEIKKEKELEIKFELFWATYPRHVSKVNAVKSFRKINPDQDLFNKIISALKRQIEFGMYTDKNFTPHPATWLNQERWNDEVIPKNHIYVKSQKPEPKPDYQRMD
ncbi:MAG TPA: hypothetical protein VMV32_08285 [Ignavibacteriaceae bacterium]|nr:hypothetical protein [Ignavibacteriaceae bacterium]